MRSMAGRWYEGRMKPATQVCWMRSPLWDVSLLALGWIPFYVWVASNSVGKNSWFGDASAGFTAAVAVALALNFAHRQYVFILVYGDRETAAERPRGYVIAPLVALFVVCGAFWSENRALQLAVLGVLGIWNAWHVIQQRYGLMRVYAGRARGGLESRAAARADRALVWSSVLVMICATAWGHAGMLEGVPQAALLLSVIGPLLTGPIVKSALAAALLVWGVVFWRSRGVRLRSRVGHAGSSGCRRSLCSQSSSCTAPWWGTSCWALLTRSSISPSYTNSAKRNTSAGRTAWPRSSWGAWAAPRSCYFRCLSLTCSCTSTATRSRTSRTTRRPRSCTTCMTAGSGSCAARASHGLSRRPRRTLAGGSTCSGGGLAQGATSRGLQRPWFNLMRPLTSVSVELALAAIQVRSELDNVVFGHGAREFSPRR